MHNDNTVVDIINSFLNDHNASALSRLAIQTSDAMKKVPLPLYAKELQRVVSEFAISPKWDEPELRIKLRVLLIRITNEQLNQDRP